VKRPIVSTVRAFELLDVNASGFREVTGYHLHADPWKEERYSDQETNGHAADARRIGSTAPGALT